MVEIEKSHNVSVVKLITSDLVPVEIPPLLCNTSCDCQFYFSHLPALAVFLLFFLKPIETSTGSLKHLFFTPLFVLTGPKTYKQK